MKTVLKATALKAPTLETFLKPLLLSSLALVLSAQGALGAGFGVYEQGGKASGLAGAFTAVADDASANWYNPAALVWLDGSELQVGTNLITAGEETDLTSSDPNFGLFSDTTFEAEGEIVTPSHIYFRHKLNNNVAFGIGINNPFGVVTDWRDRPVTFSAARSELVTFYVNPNLSLRLTETWALGVGATYMTADLEAFSREVPIDLDGNPLNGFEVIGDTDLTGDGDAWTWNVALHNKTPYWSFGLNYRHSVDVDIEGDVTFDNFGPLQGLFADSPAGGTLNLPAQGAVGIAWTGGGNWTWSFAVAWVGWSAFERVEIDIANNVPGLITDIDLREDWDDSLSYRLGASWKGAGPHEWRFGFVSEEGAVPADTLRPSIPDADRLAPTIGYGFLGRKVNVDLYYMPLFLDDIEAVGTEEGVLQGEYSSFIHLAGATLSVKW